MSAARRIRSIRRRRRLLLRRPDTLGRSILIRKFCVKPGAGGQQLFHHGFWNKAPHTKMEAKAESHPTFESQGKIVTGKTKFLKSVAPFEFRNAAVPLVAVHVSAIGKILHALLTADLDSLGDHCIGRTFVEMLVF